jgi:hypothetical protein
MSKLNANNNLINTVKRTKGNQQPKENRRNSLVGSLLNTITRLSIIIVVLLLIIGVIISAATGLWLQTYKVFTQEKLVAVIESQELKKDSEGYPYFEIIYTPVENPSAFTKFLVRDSEGSDKKKLQKTQRYDIHGDRFVVEAEVINFDDLATLLGFKTIYKVTRIKGDYSDTEQAQSGRRSIYDINGGIDPVWQTLEYNQEILHPYVDGVYGSAVTQGARHEEATWGLYMTEDGLIMKKLEND